jgi:hypothetical protein
MPDFYIIPLFENLKIFGAKNRYIFLSLFEFLKTFGAGNAEAIIISKNQKKFFPKTHPPLILREKFRECCVETKN